MKPYWTLKNITIAMLLLLTTSMTNADELTGHIGGFAGLKVMDSGDWPELNTHFAMAIMLYRGRTYLRE